MGRLVAGGLIVLFILLVGGVIAFIVDGATSSTEFVRCSGTDTNSTCENVGKTTFFSAVRDTTLLGDFGDGTPAWVTTIWIITMGFLLSLAILLIVLAFVPLTSE